MLKDFAKEMLTMFNKYEADLVLTGFSDFADGKITKILLDDSEEWSISTDDWNRKIPEELM